MAYPKGFFIDSSNGKVMYANGRQYTASGTNPDRVEGERLWWNHGLLSESFYIANLKPCTEEQAREYVTKIQTHIDQTRVELIAEHNAKLRQLDNLSTQWQMRLVEPRIS